MDGVVGQVQKQYSLAEVYPGTKPFSFDEADRFFGRDCEKMDLKHLLLAHSTVLLYGESATGKSSLLHAGVLPLLGRSACVVCRVSGTLPSGILPEAVANIHVFSALFNAAGPTDDISKLASATLLDWFGNKEYRFLIFDQFEELLTAYPERWQDRAAFFRQLGSLLEHRRDMRALFMLRQEYLAEIERFDEDLSDAFRARYQLERLRVPEAMLAILGPAKLAGIDVDIPQVSGLAKHLVEQLQTIPVEVDGETRLVRGEFIEPLHLQIVCRELVETHFSTPADEGKVINVDSALLYYYEKNISDVANLCNLPSSQLRAFIQKHLITATKTRGLVHQDAKTAKRIPNKALEELTLRSILRREKRGGSTWYELTHDRLINRILEANARWQRSMRKRIWIPSLIAAGCLIIVFAIVIARRVGALERNVSGAQPKLKQYDALLHNASDPMTAVVLLQTGNLEAASELRESARKAPLATIHAIDDALQSAKQSNQKRNVSTLKDLRWEIVRSPALIAKRATTPELNEYVCRTTVVIIGASGTQDAMTSECQRFRSQFPYGRIISPPHDLALKPGILNIDSSLFVPDVANSCDEAREVAQAYLLENLKSQPLISALSGCTPTCRLPPQKPEIPADAIKLPDAQLTLPYRCDDLRKMFLGGTIKQAGGALPDGLHLHADGTIVGVPTKTQNRPFEFTLRIRDSEGHVQFQRYSVKVVSGKGAKKPQSRAKRNGP